MMKFNQIHRLDDNLLVDGVDHSLEVEVNKSPAGSDP